MPADSRLARFIIPAAMIDDAPALVTGLMSQFVVMEGKQVLDKNGQGMAYIVWHPGLPSMPLIVKDEARDPRDSIPWLEHHLSEIQPQVFHYWWTAVASNREVVTGFFRVFVDEHGHMVSREVRPAQTAPDNDDKAH